LNTHLKSYCNQSFEGKLKQAALKGGGPAHNGSLETLFVATAWEICAGRN